LIADRLSNFTYLPTSSELENLAIALRRTRRLKLPDALIAATAIYHGLELLTLDQALQIVAKPIKT